MLRNFSEKSGELRRKTTMRKTRKSNVNRLTMSKKTEKSGRSSEYSNVLIDYDDDGDSEYMSEMDFEDLIEQEIDKQQEHNYL